MRLIDADALIDDYKKYLNKLNPSRDGKECTRIHWLIGILSNAPTIEPERKTGKWIERNPQNSDKCRLIECDQCGFTHIVGFNVPYEAWIENRNFCERCGADMRGGVKRMSDFKESEYIVYVNGDHYEIGRIVSLREDGAFVCYHDGETAAKTPYDCIHKLINGYTIQQTSLGGERFRKKVNDVPFCE